MANKNKIEEIPIIWKDRRRRMGLPLSFTRYYIKANRFYKSEGFFSLVENELLLYRILDIKTKISLWDRICGVGTLTLFTADETDKELVVKKIKKPIIIRDMISKMVEEERLKHGIAGKEIFGASNSLYDGDVDVL